MSNPVSTSTLLVAVAALLLVVPVIGQMTQNITVSTFKGRFWRGGDRVQEYGGCYHYGNKPACCQSKNGQGKKLYCFLQNSFYAQCLTVDSCKKSNYPNCKTRSRCAKDILPEVPDSKDLPEFAACFTPWDQGGVKGCCQDKNAAGEQMGCFVQNPYYSQCLTQARCKSYRFKDCDNVQQCYTP